MDNKLRHRIISEGIRGYEKPHPHLESDIKLLIDDDLIDTYPESNLTYVSGNDLGYVFPEASTSQLKTALKNLGYGMKFSAYDDDYVEWLYGGSTHRIDGPAMTFTDFDKRWIHFGREIANMKRGILYIRDEKTWNEFYDDGFNTK